MTALTLTAADLNYLNWEAVLWAKVDKAELDCLAGVPVPPEGTVYAALQELLGHMALPERPDYAPTWDELRGDPEAQADWQATIAF